MIHMDRNTSPISPLSDEAVGEVVRDTVLHEYPGDEITRFKQLYADYYGIRPEQIEVANGSDEWIQKTVMTLGQRGVMALSPDFVMYEEYSRQTDAPFYTVPCDAEFRFDFDEVVRSIEEKRPTLFLISMPHNPTGQLFDAEALERLSQAMKAVGGYLVLDEAYAEFAPAYRRPAGEHVIIIRTLSKIFGIAGLRVGIAVADGETFSRITRLNHPYPVNSLSLNLASRVFADEDELKRFTDYQLASKRQLEEVFRPVGDKIKTIESSTNFIFTYGRGAKSLGEYLKENGYQPRVYDTPPLGDVVRYSIIRLEDYTGLKKLINEWSSQYDQERKIDTGNTDFHFTR
ncbi:MAG TPA: histidinol-phosphate aminotransferase family protein [Candidatus Salinicoccus stercoripullorum]|uniref:Histidinol-phosphate aminotransferase family protein n=1 Tax=Candidatus Salinicoccus stercoripullorum TaxID=2838756 RepID=A0A9D1U0R5_9STAP|nr:histidinol-phosphate aminotransferase family protein [Candidatus Salinicoccus stercoripullorum]